MGDPAVARAARALAPPLPGGGGLVYSVGVHAVDLLFRLRLKKFNSIYPYCVSKGSGQGLNSSIYLQNISKGLNIFRRVGVTAQYISKGRGHGFNFSIYLQVNIYKVK